MKKTVIVLLSVLLMAVSFGCNKNDSKKDTSKTQGNKNITSEFKVADKIETLAELLDKNSEQNFLKEAEKPILFTTQVQYDKFTSKYFKNFNTKNINFDKYDLVFIDGKRVNPQGDTIYNLQSLSKQGNIIEFQLSEGSKFKSGAASKDVTLQNVILLKFEKGVLTSKDSFVIVKK